MPPPFGWLSGLIHRALGLVFHSGDRRDEAKHADCPSLSEISLLSENLDAAAAAVTANDDDDDEYIDFQPDVFSDSVREEESKFYLAPTTTEQSAIDATRWPVAPHRVPSSVRMADFAQAGTPSTAGDPKGPRDFPGTASAASMSEAAAPPQRVPEQLDLSSAPPGDVTSQACRRRLSAAGSELIASASESVVERLAHDSADDDDSRASGRPEHSKSDGVVRRLSRADGLQGLAARHRPAAEAVDLPGLAGDDAVGGGAPPLRAECSRKTKDSGGDVVAALLTASDGEMAVPSGRGESPDKDSVYGGSAEPAKGDSAGTAAVLLATNKQSPKHNVVALEPSAVVQAEAQCIRVSPTPEK